MGSATGIKGERTDRDSDVAGACHLGFVILIIKSNFDIWNSCFLSLIDYIEEIHPLLFWLQHSALNYTEIIVCKYYETSY